jgi:hypothetical protein
MRLPRSDGRLSAGPRARGYRWYDLGGLHNKPCKIYLPATAGTATTGRVLIRPSWHSEAVPLAIQAPWMINPAVVRIAHDLSRRSAGGRSVAPYGALSFGVDLDVK